MEVASEVGLPLGPVVSSVGPESMLRVAGAGGSGEAHPHVDEGQHSEECGWDFGHLRGFQRLLIISGHGLDGFQ